MYTKAKQQGVTFNKFAEWVNNDIKRSMFNYDHEFLEKEKTYLSTLENNSIST